MLAAFTVTEAAPPADPANILPCTTAPVLSVIETAASMFPSKAVVVSMVAELPTCQKTFLA
jgi:hypothetical protein